MFGKKFLRRRATASPATSSVDATAVVLSQPYCASTSGTSLTPTTSTLTSLAADDAVGPLGLNLLYSPDEEPVADFIFVHGLGGGSKKTWSKTQSPDHFWPQHWLPLEPAFQRVRIHTFGYSCDWTKRKLDICNIHDFGKVLLSELSTSPLLAEAEAETPLVLVGHSMGGLVIKKAYILARQDVLYRSIAKRFHTIYFLATPHRGSDSAELLNNILGVAGPSHAYIADLGRGSLYIQSLNDEFRQYSGEVQLWSFYEMRKTSIGMFSALIVDRESATLGYREERQTPMDADHRSICKFDSPMDPNYRILCNSFATTIRDVENLRLQSREKQQRDQLKGLEQYLMVPDSPENDLIALQDTRVPGTCDWFMSRQQFTRWQDFSSHGPNIFWLRGQPGGGKSVLAGHIIGHLQGASRKCSYFFFKRGDKSKTRLSNCLRSLAFQMALVDSRVLEKLLCMRDEDIKIDKDDVRSLWRKLFEAGALAVAPSTPGHYWVIDGLDECISDGSALSFLLSKLEGATSLRVFITSREVAELENHMQLLHINDGHTYCERLSSSDTLADMTTLIRTRMQAWAIRDERDRTALGAKILAKSKGCFLWSALVLSRMTSAHGKEQIHKVLDNVPHEMEPLYLETLESMSKISENKALAKAILTWAACAVRPLTIQELNGALVLEMKDEFPNLKESILALCGQLVQVDKTGVVHMVHETAREFLLSGKLQSEFAISNVAAHTHLATTCFAALTSKEMRPPRTRRRGPGPTTPSPKPPFIGYACEAFSDHLALSDPSNLDLCLSAHKFLGANVLSWIEVIAQKQNLSPMIRTAKNFEKYLAAAAAIRPPLDKEARTMRSWSTDLVRIAARFGDAILVSPSAIHWVVLPFCPIESAVYKAASPGQKLTIAGLHNTQWDDRLVCLNFHRGQTTAVCHGDDLFAVALNTGAITLYHTISCQEYMTLEHPEAVKLLEFDAQTELLASGGRRKICVWNVRTGELIHRFALAKPLMSLSFEGDLLLAPDTACHISTWSMADGSVSSRRWFDSVDEDNAEPAYPPCAVSISRGHRMMAVAYRGRPITLWDLEEDSFYRFCGKGSTDGVTGPYFANDLVFNPNEDIPRLVVAYQDGDIMLLNPFRDEIIACFRANTHTLAASPDGRLVVGADGFGTIQVYDFETLRVIYRIKSVSCSIKHLAFSRDGLRFLDIRTSECNIWEPTVLLKDSGADTSSQATSTGAGIEETAAIGYSVVISTIVIHPRGEFIICGKEDGSITLYDMKSGSEVRDLYRPKSQCLTRMLGWWDDGQVLVGIDASNTVTAWKLGKHLSNGWNIVEMLFQTRVDCAKAIIQLHVNQASGKFVLSTRDTDHLWSIDGQQEEGRISSTCRRLRTWIDHPQSLNHLICMDGPIVQVFAWEDWSETTSVTLPAAQPFRRAELQVKRIFPCSKGRKLLVEFSEQEGHQDTRDITVVDTSLFQLPNASPPPLKHPSPSTSPIDADLVDKIVHIIGVSDDKFIFVDIHSWVCSADIEQPWATYLRHFFVPYDWFSKMRGIICEFMERAGEKNVVFARHNSAVIVRNALEFSERVGSVGEEGDFAIARRA